MAGSRLVFNSAILLSFVIGLEILIMISPFAVFFYAAFNPFLLSLVQHSATRWLAAFFLPHMVMPADPILQALRVSGSFLFLGGAAVFLVCAIQVYANKFLERGVAMKGLYLFVRHPQYAGLAATGLGLAILWPRFLVIALWSVMLVLYYLLAADEERRMLRQYKSQYGRYMAGTGMFLPRSLESRLPRIIPAKPGWVWGLALAGGVIALTVAGAFGMRAYTVHSLPLWSEGNVTVLPIMPRESFMVEHRMVQVLEIPQIRRRLASGAGQYLAYFMDPGYIMQGMIADTGGEWRLYMQHKTLPMIMDWIIHPFKHLEGGYCTIHPASGMQSSGNGVLRRLIFVCIDITGRNALPSDLFSLSVPREPVFYADVDIHNLVLKSIHDLPAETGWGRMPTPMF